MSTLRYLRSNHDFFFTQLTKFPLNVQLLAEDEEEGKPDEQVLNSRQVSLINQQAWFLKSVAIELRLTSLNHRRSHAQRIVNLLLNEPTDPMEELDHMSNPLGTASDDYGPALNVLNTTKRKILVLLDVMDFSESWRQLVEVMLHSLVHVGVKQGLKVDVLFELIQDSLIKVCMFRYHGHL